MYTVDVHTKTIALCVFYSNVKTIALCVFYSNVTAGTTLLIEPSDTELATKSYYLNWTTIPCAPLWES